MSSFARRMQKRYEAKILNANKIGMKQAQASAVKATMDIHQAVVKQKKLEGRMRRNCIHNLFSCFLYAMHSEHGFGNKGENGRLTRLRDKMKNVFESITGGYVSVEEIVNYLQTDIKFNIKIINTQPENRQRQIEDRTFKEISAAFLMSMIDEFGWKKKRLGKAYQSICNLDGMLKRKEITFKEIDKRLYEAW